MNGEMRDHVDQETSDRFVDYVARVEGQVQYRPGAWHGLKIGVYGVRANGAEERLGEYERNYSSQMQTFYPFRCNGRDFALYSPDYTSSRILSLPDCKEVGAEVRDAAGFCPVGYFVPRYLKYRYKGNVYYVYYQNEEPGQEFRKLAAEYEDAAGTVAAFR